MSLLLFCRVLELGFKRFDKSVPDVVVVIIDWVEAVEPDGHIISPSIDFRSFDVSESDGHFSKR